MKRKTTQSPKPRVQVTLGPLPLPPHPQAGHRAIAAHLHHHPALNPSHSHNLYLFGWHPKPEKSPSVGFFFYWVLQDINPNWVCHHLIIMWRSLTYIVWRIALAGSNGQNKGFDKEHFFVHILWYQHSFFQMLFNYFVDVKLVRGATFCLPDLLKIKSRHHVSSV